MPVLHGVTPYLRRLPTLSVRGETLSCASGADLRSPIERGDVIIARRKRSQVHADGKTGNSRKQHEGLTNRPWNLHERVEWEVDLMKMRTNEDLKHSSASNKNCSWNGRIHQLVGGLGRKRRFVVLLLRRLDGELLRGQTLASASGSEEIRHGTGKASPRKIFFGDPQGDSTGSGRSTPGKFGK
jgi:hypothetical protein